MTSLIQSKQINSNQQFPKTCLLVSQFGNDIAKGNYGSTTGTGWINTSSDFPTLAAVSAYDCYMVPSNTTVTDNDPSKTNTGQTIIGPVQIAWNPTTSLWSERDGYSKDTCFSSICAANWVLRNRNNNLYPDILVSDNGDYLCDHLTLGAPLGTETNSTHIIAPAARITIVGVATLCQATRISARHLFFNTNGYFHAATPDKMSIEADIIENDASTTTCGFYADSASSITVKANYINANAASTIFFKSTYAGLINVICPQIIGAVQIDSSPTHKGYCNIITSNRSQLTYTADSNINVSANLSDVSYDDSLLVHKANSETITGLKTFDSSGSNAGAIKVTDDSGSTSDKQMLVGNSTGTKYTQCNVVAGSNLLRQAYLNTPYTPYTQPTLYLAASNQKEWDWHETQSEANARWYRIGDVAIASFAAGGSVTAEIETRSVTTDVMMRVRYQINCKSDGTFLGSDYNILSGSITSVAPNFRMYKYATNDGYALFVQLSASTHNLTKVSTSVTYQGDPMTTMIIGNGSNWYSDFNDNGTGTNPIDSSGMTLIEDVSVVYAGYHKPKLVTWTVPSADATTTGKIALRKEGSFVFFDNEFIAETGDGSTGAITAPAGTILPKFAPTVDRVYLIYVGKFNGNNYVPILSKFGADGSITFSNIDGSDFSPAYDTFNIRSCSVNWIVPIL
jgi:hypothetical protein